MSLYKVSGYLSLFFGVLATLGCLHPDFLFFGLFCSVIGFIFSIIHIFINTKYDISKKLFTRAHWGMLLASVPVIYLLLIIFVFKN